MVTVKRHIAKTISYRLLSSTVGYVFVYTTTGSMKIGLTFSIMELVYKPIQYFVHERIWYKHIGYGIEKEKDSLDSKV
jgi:uncharacterized membrane protein